MTVWAGKLCYDAGMGVVGGLSLIACCFAAVAAAALPFPSNPQQARRDPDIDAVWLRLDQAWNDRDSAAFGAVFTPAATFELPGQGAALDGRTAIEKHFAAQFPTYPKELRHKTTVTAVRDLASDLALVDGGVEVLRTSTEGGTEPTAVRKFSLSAGMQRTNDRWLIRWLRAYRLP
jgi:uncharacterized protein (TIGR02246 family)